MEGIKKAMNEKNLSEDRKKWSLGVGQRRKSFETDIQTYIHTYKSEGLELHVKLA
jgi:hypothetical protein